MRPIFCPSFTVKERKPQPVKIMCQETHCKEVAALGLDSPVKSPTKSHRCPVAADTLFQISPSTASSLKHVYCPSSPLHLCCHVWGDAPSSRQDSPRSASHPKALPARARWVPCCLNPPSVFANLWCVTQLLTKHIWFGFCFVESTFPNPHSDNCLGGTSNI